MNTQLFYSTMPSPIGELTLVSDGETLKGTYMDTTRSPPRHPSWKRDDKVLRPVRAQLDAYFAGELREFTMPLLGDGTAFQQKVWKAL